MNQQDKIKSDLQAYVASLKQELSGYEELQGRLRTAQRALSAFEPQDHGSRNGKTGRVLMVLQTFEGSATMSQLTDAVPGSEYVIAQMVKRGELIARKDPAHRTRSLYTLPVSQTQAPPQQIPAPRKPPVKRSPQGAPTQLSRVAVYEAIAAAGPEGAKMRELAELLGKPGNAVSYHAQILRDEGYVKTAGKLTGTRWIAVKKYEE